MQVKAFVLIQTEIEIAKTVDVVASLKKLAPGVASVERVTGPYDIIVAVIAESLDEINVLVTERIHATSGVYRTVTCLAV